MTQRVAVVTDSSSCLPPEVADAWGIDVVPLYAVVDGEARPEGEPGLTADVERGMRTGSRVTTSQPSLGECLEAFEHAAARAESVVAITLSAGMSGTHGVMELAAAQMGGRVTVVDSRTVSLATGFAALSAAAAAREGAPADAVAREAVRVARSSLCLFTVESLEYLRRGGRVSPAVAAMGQALMIRPVLGVVAGEVGVVDRVRTATRARTAMLDRVGSRARALRTPVLGLMRMPSDALLETEARDILARRGRWPVLSAELSAVLAAHTGPGTLAAVVADVSPEVAASLVVPSL